jgi:hypothetical protein
VAESRDLDVDLSSFAVRVSRRGDRFAATVDMVDPFTTGAPLKLELELFTAAGPDTTDVFALVAPSTAGAAMWATLHEIASQW